MPGDEKQPQLCPSAVLCVSWQKRTLSASNMGVPMRHSMYVKNAEPTVDELLADPITHLVMSRDGVEPGEVLAAIERARETMRRNHERSVNVPAAA
jgi:hypothetical protein